MLTSAVLLLTASIAAEPASLKMPDNVRAAMQFLVGESEIEVKSNGSSFKGTCLARWAAGKNCLVMTIKSDFFTAAGVGGWEPTTNAYVETWYRSDGLRIEQRYLHITENVWEGTATVQGPSGATDNNVLRLEKTEDGFAMTAKSDKGTFAARHKRVTKQKP